jgi:POT family proton-dependent oligopeptide transporter
MGIAFLYYWPVLLALVSQAAPPRMNATLMGGAFLSFFIGSVAMGWIGSFYDQMSPAAFWGLDAAIALVGGAIVLVIGRPLARALEPPIGAGPV